MRSVEGRKRIASELIATLSLCSSDSASPSPLSLLAADSPVMPLLQLQDRNLALHPGPSGKRDALGAIVYTQGKPVPEKVGRSQRNQARVHIGEHMKQCVMSHSSKPDSGLTVNISDKSTHSGTQATSESNRLRTLGAYICVVNGDGLST